MADGYPIEAQTANLIETEKARIKEWQYSQAVFLTHPGQPREAPEPGEIFVRPISRPRSASWSRPSRRRSRRARAGRKRSTPRTIASIRATSPQELVRGVQEEGGLITMEDLAGLESADRGAGLDHLQGHHGLQAPVLAAGTGDAPGAQHSGERRPQGDGVQLHPYLHTLYQAMNLAFADRDFYYGDPSFPPEEPVQGLLSKEYAKQRLRPDRLGPQRSRPSSRAIPIPSRAEPTPSRLARALDGHRRAGHRPASGQQDRPLPQPETQASLARSRLRSTPAPRRSRPPTRRAGWCRSRRAAAGFRR